MLISQNFTPKRTRRVDDPAIGTLKLLTGLEMLALHDYCPLIAVSLRFAVVVP